MDIVSAEKRSRMMAGIGSKNTKPERIVRSVLHRMGYRFRLHRIDLPGSPDIVLAKHRTVVLVHGCFWHRHAMCKYAYTPKSRVAFWQRKFEQNVIRDHLVQRQLHRLGWHVIVIWECQTRDTERLGKLLAGRFARIRQHEDS